MNEISTPHHDCIWDVIGIQEPPSHYVPAHPRIAPQPVFTVVLVRCRYCRVPTTLKLEGNWTEDQIRESANVNDKTSN